MGGSRLLLDTEPSLGRVLMTPPTRSADAGVAALLGSDRRAVGMFSAEAELRPFELARRRRVTGGLVTG